jgi:hypothetical protein
VPAYPLAPHPHPLPPRTLAVPTGFLSLGQHAAEQFTRDAEAAAAAAAAGPSLHVQVKVCRTGLTFLVEVPQSGLLSDVAAAVASLLQQSDPALAARLEPCEFVGADGRELLRHLRLQDVALHQRPGGAALCVVPAAAAAATRAGPPVVLWLQRPLMLYVNRPGCLPRKVNRSRLETVGVAREALMDQYCEASWSAFELFSPLDVFTPMPRGASLSSFVTLNADALTVLVAAPLWVSLVDGIDAEGEVLRRYDVIGEVVTVADIASRLRGGGAAAVSAASDEAEPGQAAPLYRLGDPNPLPPAAPLKSLELGGRVVLLTKQPREALAQRDGPTGITGVAPVLSSPLVRAAASPEASSLVQLVPHGQAAVTPRSQRRPSRFRRE